MPKERDGVVLYWRPGCPYCMKMRLLLKFTRLRHTKVNIWKDSEAAAFVRSVADGNETVPTLTVAGRAMVNPSKKRLMEAVGTYAPDALPQDR
ncbi:glutaredoxin domain-containing protein [Streptomyces iconiensis]|uniref:Glutaredoxin domain-containing protein n=1 Tax=Streptomyces iconiensis TaxID=1384038 RepID=A0ABT7A7D7_9ACTN|nr:glutaredoxin domain-containing protein [Streptomyces iconiensis]MDJ1137236.1 glutaredoxin domain-containing protein [Streptomyces iconiensis]